MNKVSDVIAEFLKELDIKIVFGIIGSANSHIFDSITKLGFTKIVHPLSLSEELPESKLPLGTC